MINNFIKRISLLWLVFLLPALAQGAPPDGNYQLNFGGNLSVWDVSGTYTEDDFGTSSSFILVQDDKGKITGTGTASASESGFTINLNFTLSGAIKAVAAVTRTDFNMKYSGTADDGFQIHPVTGKMRLMLVIDNSTSQMTGTAKGSICVKRVGCARIDDIAQFQIPNLQDGTWQLNLAISPTADGKRLTGTGKSILANGREELFTLTGKYLPSTDRAQLKLKGSAGLFTLQTNVVGTNMAVQMMNAKLLGQKVRTP